MPEGEGSQYVLVVCGRVLSVEKKVYMAWWDITNNISQISNVDHIIKFRVKFHEIVVEIKYSEDNIFTANNIPINRDNNTDFNTSNE